MSLYSGPTASSGNQPEPQKYSIKRSSYSNAWYFFPHWYNYSESVGWIGTGDATLEVKKVREAWKKTYDQYYNQISTLLLPHHGSWHNFHSDLLEFPHLEYCIASAGNRFRYNHPDSRVIFEVHNQQMIFHHVSEQLFTGFIEEIKLLRRSASH